MRTSIDATPIWKRLEEHCHTSSGLTLRQLFTDAERAAKFSFDAGDLHFDFSKHLVDDVTFELLFELARTAQVESKRDAMFAGDAINTTENRPVLHSALRSKEPVFLDGVDVVADVREVLVSMARVADTIRDGKWFGASAKAIRSVVNIGIGGSDLGPAMCTEALSHLKPDNVDIYFVSNIDAADLNRTLAKVDAETTLFIVASKSFTTIETMTNAQSARDWLHSEFAAADSSVSLTDVTRRHMVAVSTNENAVSDFGIDTENMFGFWDWVGGRYSVDSAIGLALMCAIGSKNFAEFLDGFSKMDHHFRTEPLESNVPVVAALLGVWYRNFLGLETHAVLPYSQALSLLPAYLQQLDMESNGKSVTIEGEPTSYGTAPVIWGEPGTNGQHAFYQMLHQGTTVVPADFIGFLRAEPGSLPAETTAAHHRLLYANMVAQTQALAFGRSAKEVRSAGVDADLVAHRSFTGNRPTTTITAETLTPSTLGQIIAFYEHRTFVQGAVWGINSFDQWGVELGKVLAKDVEAHLVEGLDDAANLGLDSSTVALIERFRKTNSDQTFRLSQ